MQKNREKKETTPLRAVPVIIFATALIGIMMVSFIRSNAKKWFPAAIPKTTESDALKWLQAVKANNAEHAILLAKKMIADDNPELPAADYLTLMLKLKISTLILTSPFNKYDFIRWRDAIEIQNIVTANKTTDQDQLETLFKLMTGKIKLIPEKDKSYTPTASVFEIWNKKTASTREQCRLFAALAQQAGYDVQIVSIYSKEGKMVHIVCEIRNNSDSYVADPRFRKIWKNASVAKFANNNTLVTDFWTPSIIESLNINRKIYELPAEPQDYKIINNKLYKKLITLGVPEMQKFAFPPQTQIDEYIKKYQDKNQSTAFSYWTFPFYSLMSSPDFPEEWRLVAPPESVSR